jgi:hypothetical protein
MYICNGTTGWGIFLNLCEYITTIALGYLFTMSIIVKNRNKELKNYETLDLIIIILSTIQIYIILLCLLLGTNYGLSLLEDLFKFSQNALLAGCLLLTLWHYHSTMLEFIKYLIIAMLIFDFIVLLSILFSNIEFFETKFCKSTLQFIMIILGLVINVSTIIYSMYKKYNKIKDFIPLNDEHFILSPIMRNCDSNIKRMKNFYLNLLFILSLSYLVDVYYKSFMVVIDPVSGGCVFLNDKGGEFDFGNFLFCSLSFALRDILPHCYIFIEFFRRQTNVSRSSLIEPL